MLPLVTIIFIWLLFKYNFYSWNYYYTLPYNIADCLCRSKKNAKPVPKKVSEEEDSDDSLIGDHSPFVRTTRSKRSVNE